MEKKMKKTIKILGTGCANCKKTTAIVQDVVNSNNINAEVLKIENIVEIMEYEVMSTPAVVIDEKVVISGRVPQKDEIAQLLK